MIKVAICEDRQTELALLQKIMEYLLKDRGLEYEMTGYDSGETLVAEYENHPFDLVLLDIIMPNINGIEAGKKIRKVDSTVEIIYCTSSKDFAIAAYEIHAMGYLLKPYEPCRIGALLDYYVQKHPQKNSKYIEVKSKRRSVIIPYKDIIYMESENKVVYFHTTNQGTVKVYNKLDVFQQQIQDSRFLRCHQSYLVNLQYIAGLVGSDFITIDDNVIPIRKTGRKLIMKQYEDYLNKLGAELE